MKFRPLVTSCLVAAGTLLTSTGALAQDATAQALEQYRQLLQDGNPAEVLALEGEALWMEKRGPKNASLETCDLGKGPGVVEGAYVELPRYFEDTQKVMDFEGRLVYCMETIQGFDPAKVTKKPHSGRGEPQTDLETLTAYVVEASRGLPVNLPQDHPEEKASYERGKKSFFYRSGPYDFSCATCHSVDNLRIRLQDLPNLTGGEAAKKAFSTWPAYRVSHGAMRTMQWRMRDCFKQQRFPFLKYASQTSVDLITYLGVNAKGVEMNAPAVKR